MQDFLPLITGGGGALVVLSLVAWGFYSGKLHSHREFVKLERENASLRDALDRKEQTSTIERQATVETARAAAVTNRLLDAFLALAAANRPPGAGPTAKGPGP